MKCEECKQHLLGYAYGELPPKLTQEVSDALEGCETCQQELARITQVRSAFQSADFIVEPPATMRANILREARLGAYAVEEASASTWLDKLGAILFHPGMATAAAVVLVAIGIFYVAGDEALRPDEPRLGEVGATRSDAPAVAEKAQPPSAPAEALAEVDEEESDHRFATEGAVADKAPGGANKPLREAVAAVGDKDTKKGNATSERLRAKAEAPSPTAPNPSPVVDEVAEQSAQTSNMLAPSAKDAPTDTNVKVDPAPPARLKLEDQKESDKRLAEDANKDLDGAEDDDYMIQRGMRDAIAKDDTPKEQAEEKPAAEKDTIDDLLTGNSSVSGPSYGYRRNSDDNADSASIGQAGSGEDKRITGIGGEDNQEAYNSGISRFHRGDYSGAITEFDSFMNNAPSSDNYYALALFHKGRSEFNQRNYSAAVASFRKVIADHPGTEKIPESRYWLAQSLIRLDPNNNEARRILESLSGGSGGLADKAREDYNRAFGKRDAEKRKTKPVQRKAAPSKPKKSFDYEAPEPQLDLTE